MELIEGRSLQEFFDNLKSSGEEWPLFQRLELFNKLCDAVAFAHSKNVLHLDIKPDNIRMGTYGEIILCDWGLSHTLDTGKTDVEIDLTNNQTLHGYLKGTPGYMAPEQIDGVKSKSVDIFALGGILFSLLTLEAPFSGKNLDEVLENTRERELNCPQKHAAIPKRLFPVIHKALAEEGRYTSVDQLQAEVQKFREGFATEAEQASAWTQLALLYKRKKWLFNVSLLFLILFIA